MKAIYIKGSTLEWPDLWQSLGLRKDNGGRWYPSKYTQESVARYLDGYRSPSRAWPNSYATALLTQKFAKYLCEAEPELAVKLKIAVEG